ncbi:hypothetical protein GCM10011349_44440 [Novosphingobium indicum]|uniref:Uncharacterized protein n=1 Tax=Novosphingobium indicum TaxID=462949 RepID=A0ABQ2K1I5_9SPHN|nr:hypothetical protein [Novosphingobium indicum]GGN61633.1 hypothetical protein GCM10011349_44440 [Novosphingobium indicum]
MTELDTLLARLGEEPAGSRLDGLEVRVMHGVARRREQIVERRGYLLACCLAIVVGTAASAMPGTPSSTEPLLGLPASAPSHLLID